MKYIKTKDGRIVDNEIMCIRFADDNILNQADTIEELCDELVFHTLDGHEQHFLSHSHFEDVLKNKNIKLKDYLSCRTIYGAIWTEKGLIYVAKMNEDGELELL